MFRTARLPRGILAAAALTIALTLSGCAAGQISQTADQVSPIDGANGNAGMIGVRNVLLATAPANGYAKGADVPMTLLISNDGLSGDTLSGATSTAATSVAIGGAASGGGVAVPQQSLLSVTEDSTVTFTLKGLTAPLVYGKTVPVVFNFATAGAISVNVPIAIPAERSGARPTVDIQPTEPGSLWESGEAAGS